MNKPLLTSALLLVPLSMFSLGLGNLKILSKLNQPFKAEIPLLDTSGVNLTSVKVSFASLEEFERAGLARDDEVLSRLTFSIKKNDVNQQVIMIQSLDRISEPYIEMMIDLAWPKGQFYREYIVLLDPPDYDIPTQNTSLKGSIATKNYKKAGVRSDGGISQKTAYTHIVNHGQAAIPTVGKKTTYGPTLINEDIWQIAQRYTSTDITLPQVILSIVGTNSSAFTQGNLNGLKVGVKLSIPPIDDISKIPASLAKQEVEAHDIAWRNNQEIHHVILPPYLDAVQGVTQFDNSLLQQSSLARIPEFNESNSNQEIASVTTYPMMSYIPAISTTKLFKSVLSSNIANIENAQLKQQLNELAATNAQLQRVLAEQTTTLNALKKASHEAKPQESQSNENGYAWSYFWLLLTLGSTLFLAYHLYSKRYAEEDHDEIEEIPSEEINDPKVTAVAKEATVAGSFASNSEVIPEQSDNNLSKEGEVAIPAGESLLDTNLKDFDFDKNDNEDNMIEYDFEPEDNGRNHSSIDLENVSASPDANSDSNLINFTESDEKATEESHVLIETQLDLAKTYIAMDDSASAVEYLEEVVAKGTSAQQEEAKSLLSTLNSK